MCRVAGSSLSWLSTVQPSMSGRKMSSEIADGPELPRQRQALRALQRHKALEAAVARQAEHDARVVRVVLDDQQHRVAFGDAVAVVATCASRATGSTLKRVRADGSAVASAAGAVRRLSGPANAAAGTA